MSKLICKTKNGISPQGKPKVYFCAHPEDFPGYFESVTDSILKIQDCAVWYDAEPEAAYDSPELLNGLSQMQLFVVPVTSRFLRQPNRGRDLEVPYAFERHIPVLPLMEEPGLDNAYKDVFFDLHYLDPNVRDITAETYEQKLEKYLGSVLVGNELAEKVRAAFDAYIFLSYRKKDRRYAQELMRLIHKNEFCRDIAIWYDEFLTPGESFNDAIGEALLKSRLFALAVTPNLVNEVNYVMTTEYPMAKNAGKAILPAELVSTDPALLKAHYSDIPPCVSSDDEAALSAELMRTLAGLAKRETDGDPAHNFLIGLAYLTGIDVDVNHDRASELITGAGEAGLTEAMEKLVAMYRNGDGVERNYRTAITWQEKLVEQAQAEHDAEPSEGGFVTLFTRLQTLYEYISELVDPVNADREMGLAYDVVSRMIKTAEKENALRNTLVTRRSVVKSKRIMGDLLLKAGRLVRTEDFIKYFNYRKGADSYYKSALEIGTALAEETGELEDRYELAASYHGLARVKQADKKSEEALEYFQKNIDTLEEINSPDARYLLAACYQSIGDILTSSGKADKATEQYRRSLDSFSALAAELGSIEYRGAVAMAYEKLAKNSEKRNDMTEAVAYWDKAIELSEALAKETNLKDERRYLAIEYTYSGDDLRTDGKFAEAEARYQKAFELRKKLAEEFGTLVCRRDLSESYRSLGKLYHQQEKYSDAVECYEKALAISKELYWEVKDANAKSEMVKVQFSLGILKQHIGKPEEAAMDYEEALAAANGLADFLSPYAVSCFTVPYIKRLADIRRDQGRMAEALKLYKDEFEIRYAIAFDKRTAKALREAAECSMRITLLCLELGKAEDAAKYAGLMHTVAEVSLGKENTPENAELLKKAVTLKKAAAESSK